ncbi:MAG: hypothetical protein R3B98_10330 [Hyphomonas sp.]
MMQRLILGGLAGLATLPAAADPASPLDSPAIAAALNGASLPVDACGGEDLLDVAVPDGIFLEACRTHDACYRSGALDQGACDRLFLDRMRAACDATFDPYDKPMIHATCRVGAALYYSAVNSRFGAMAYPDGTTDGQILNSLQARLAEADGTDELRVCTDVANTSNRKMRYLLVLHDAKGQWVDTAPALGKVSLNPGKVKEICVDTDYAPWANWDSVGAAYAVTLLADDPDRLTPFGDLIPLDRLECDKASGDCRHAAP